MTEAVLPTLTGETPELMEPLDLGQMLTEDDTPVDNLFSEKQQRLLVESLYGSWVGMGASVESPAGKFLAAANVAVYYGLHQPPIVPDVFLSLDVEVPEDWYAKNKRSYFVWEFGKVPEVAVEIVSNAHGQEDSRKLQLYARIGVDYYVIVDPTRQLSTTLLRVYERRQRAYVRLTEGWLEGVQLGVRLWEGVYEGKHSTWIRWHDRSGALLLTGAERAEQERLRAEQEYQRAERLAAQLRTLGVEPDSL